MNDFSEEKINFLKNANAKLRLNDDLSVEKNRRLIFVYTPPKVGSTSLISSFRISANKRSTILHIHNEKMLQILCGITNVTINEIILYNRRLGKEVYVIDVYRTPIEWKMSMFFERICDYHFNNHAEKVNGYDIQKIILRFNNIFKYLCTEDYFKEVYNIQEVIPDSFPFDKKYLVVEKEGIKFIKLRLNDSNEWENQLREIMGMDVKIIKDYETENKDIAALYRRMKDEYRIPSNRLREIEENPFFQYYNNEEERHAYLEKWRSKQGPEVEGYTAAEYELYKKVSDENKWIPAIQQHHYIDEGCECSLCEERRRQVVGRLERGEISNPRKIMHEQMVDIAKKIETMRRMEKIKRVGEIIKKNNETIQRMKAGRKVTKIIKGKMSDIM